MDRDYDLALLPVGLHIPVCVGNGVQGEGPVDNGFQGAGFEAGVDIAFATGEFFAVADNFE